MTVSIKIKVLSDVLPCCCVDTHQHFRKSAASAFYHEDGAAGSYETWYQPTKLHEDTLHKTMCSIYMHLILGNCATGRKNTFIRRQNTVLTFLLQQRLFQPLANK